MITELSLAKFRNHNALHIETHAPQILLSGLNGSGKTSILEAISLLMPGRGIRGAHMFDILHKQNRKKKLALIENTECVIPNYSPSIVNAWQIDATIFDADNRVFNKVKCTYYAHRNSREISFNNKAHNTSLCLIDKISLISLTPRMDFIFLDAASERRKLMDRIIYNFVRQHAHDVNDYDQQLRARMKLLKNNCTDNRWLYSIEFSLALISVRIAIRRLLIVKMLNDIMPLVPSSFCQVVVDIDGKIENTCKTLLSVMRNVINQVNSNDEITAINLDLLQYTTIESIGKMVQIKLFMEEYNKTVAEIQKHFELSRTKDIASKQSNYGIHKTDLVLHNVEKDIAAKKSSTGEQKSMIISLILAQTLLTLEQNKNQNKNRAVILLLDDILQHLDFKRCYVLLDMMQNLPVQTWITGTDLDYCSTLLKNCIKLNLDNHHMN